MNWFTKNKRKWKTVKTQQQKKLNYTYREKTFPYTLAQSAGAVEYTDCTSAEG